MVICEPLRTEETSIPVAARIDLGLHAGFAVVERVEQILDRFVARDVDIVGLSAVGDLQPGRSDRDWPAAAGRLHGGAA